MEDIWDQRYSIEEYYYGTEPNEYLKDKLSKLQAGRILLTAEGEGRNAVFCAESGWDVVCYDTSQVGKTKADALAEMRNVRIDYRIDSHKSFNSNDKFDVIAICYNHLPSFFREFFHTKILQNLKKDGYLILECFNKNQINNNTGGPKDIDQLYSLQDLLNDFKGLQMIEAIETDVNLNEGKGHVGISSVVRIFAKNS